MSRKSILAIVVAAIAATTVFAQAVPQLTGDSLLRALLDEMRMLRTSLQKNSAYEIRGRLLIDRARMHQETIRELSRELESAVDFPPTEPTMIEEDIEARMERVPNPDDRERMREREKKMIEHRRAMEARHREQMRMRYQRMEQRLAEEKEKLAAIEEELAQIHRELTK